MMTATDLHIPDITEDDDALSAALAYADGGFYVLPVAPGSKHPGSVLGNGWQHQSTRDPQQIAAWWAGTGHGIALHAGRSGAVIIDVDDPQELPEPLIQAILDPEVLAPHQSTRADVTGRGHYVYAAPPGRTIGNSTGTLGAGWGDVRGRNGVIVTAPTRHEHADSGGRYHWVRTGVVPQLPSYVAACLPEASTAVDAATDTEVAAFLGAHTTGADTALMRGLLDTFTRDVRAGKSRHQAAISTLTGALKEAAAGYYPAADAEQALREAFLRAVVGQPGTSGHARDLAEARREWAGIIAWSVAQARTATPEDVHERVREHRPIDLTGPPQATTPTPTRDTTVEPPRSIEDTPEAEDPPSTWAPLDLTAYVDGTWEPPTPTLLPRTDGHGLIYPGLVHSMHGESESGKSMVMQIESVRVLHNGGRVLYLDFESDAGSITERFVNLGASRAELLERLHYVAPEGHPRGTVANEQAWNNLLAGTYDLAVIDGVTDSLGMWGASSKDNDDITRWMRELPRRIAAETGAAVVIIDHVAKDTENRGRFAIGGQAKMAALTGAGYVVEVKEPLGRGMRGILSIRVGKDRPGGVRGIAGRMRQNDRTQEVARVIVDSTNGEIVATIEPQAGSDVEPGTVKPFRLTGIMEKISILLENTTDPLSQRSIEDDIEAKSARTRAALRTLVDEGYVTVTEGAKQAHLHTLIKPYRQKSDPESDLFDPLAGGLIAPARPSASRASQCVPSASRTQLVQCVPSPPSPTGGDALKHSDEDEEKSSSASRPRRRVSYIAGQAIDRDTGEVIE